MFRPLALYIGFRYTRAKKSNHFVSFVALVSMMGIALGITVLITVLSVMNGFDDEIHNKIFNVVRQVTVTGPANKIKDWQSVQKAIAENKDIIASAPYIAAQGMLTKDGASTGVMVTGVLPEEEVRVSSMQDFMAEGSMLALKPREFGIVLGWHIAGLLKASIGDKVILVTPEARVTPIGVEPRFKKFTVVGIFQVGEGFGHDSTTAFINLNDAQKLFSLGKNVTGVNVKIKDLYRAQIVSEDLRQKLQSSALIQTETESPNVIPENAGIQKDYYISNWTREYGSFFKAIQMEKTTMFVVLLFIIAVAVFNLVASLVMTVTDKQSDIAILRTLGATPKMIMGVFIVQGGIIGLFGTLLGILGGVLLAINAPDLVVMLEQIFHTQFISAGVYFIDHLPSKLEFTDIWRVGLISLAMSLLATIYPAWRAAKTQPAKALRYE